MEIVENKVCKTIVLPKLSIIVPVYNTEKYIGRCIDSILEQTFTDFELLLIDDGSFDRSGAICEEYACKDQRVRVFHKDNGGVSSARNFGLDNANGEWIAFVDSDDYIEPYFLEGACLDIELSDLVLLPYKIIDIQTLEDISQDNEWNKPFVINSYLKNIDNILRLCVTTGKLFKSKLIGSLRFNPQLKFGEDTVFMINYFAKCLSLSYSKIENDNHYVWVSETSANNDAFERKYRLTVKEAAKSMKEVYLACKELRFYNYIFLRDFMNNYRRVCDYDMKQNWKEWYMDKTIRELAIKLSQGNRLLNRIKIQLLYSKYGYLLLSKLGYK